MVRRRCPLRAIDQPHRSRGCCRRFAEVRCPLYVRDFRGGEAGAGQAATLRWSGRQRRLPCDARDPGLAHNSLRAARFARTDAPSLMLKRAARAARVAVLLGAPQAHRVLPRTVFAAALVVFGPKQPRRDAPNAEGKQPRANCSKAPRTATDAPCSNSSRYRQPQGAATRTARVASRRCQSTVVQPTPLRQAQHGIDGRHRLPQCLPAVPGAADHRQADPAALWRQRGGVGHLPGLLSGRAAAGLCLRAPPGAP